MYACVLASKERAFSLLQDYRASEVAEKSNIRKTEKCTISCIFKSYISSLDSRYICLFRLDYLASFIDLYSLFKKEKEKKKTAEDRNIYKNRNITAWFSWPHVAAATPYCWTPYLVFSVHISMRLARAAEREALPFSSTQVRLSWFLPWHAGNAEISSFQFQKRKKEEEKKKKNVASRYTCMLQKLGKDIFKLPRVADSIY